MPEADPPLVWHRGSHLRPVQRARGHQQVNVQQVAQPGRAELMADGLMLGQVQQGVLPACLRVFLGLDSDWLAIRRRVTGRFFQQ